MKTKLQRFLIVALSFELLLSSIGVAQVNHFCKMALAGIEKTSCIDSKSPGHDCCLITEADAEKSKDESCCSDEVKYFNNKVNSTIQEFFKVIPIYVATLKLPYSAISIPELSTGYIFYTPVAYPTYESGQQIILSKQSLLI